MTVNRARMRITIVGLMAAVFALSAHADTFDRPLSSGVVTVKAQAAASSPDLTDTASLGLRRTDTGVVVFCMAVNPGETVMGESESIANLGAEVLLQLFAFSDIRCVGRESPGSDDLYRVVFGAPGKPMLLRVD